MLTARIHLQQNLIHHLQHLALTPTNQHPRIRHRTSLYIAPVAIPRPHSDIERALSSYVEPLFPEVAPVLPTPLFLPEETR